MEFSFVKFLLLSVAFSITFQVNPKYVKNQLLLIPYPQSVEANFGASDSLSISPELKLIIEQNSNKCNKHEGFLYLNQEENPKNSPCDENCQNFLKDNFDFSITKTLTSQKGLSDFRLSLHKQLDLEQIIPDIKATVDTVTLSLTDEKVFPELTIGVKEDYELYINRSAISIKASTVYGARHAFETLAQLIRISPEKTFVITQVPITIKDFPRFKWRGILIDPVRNVFDPSMFYRIVDALAMLKNNIIHIHLSDGQAFLFESTQYKDLSDKGSPHPTKVFTKEFIKKLVEYGKKRGVIIYGEIDIPAHAAAMNLGYPGIVADCWDHVTGDHINYGENRPALNPADNRTLEIVLKVVEELGEAFGNDFVHIGGDEVNSKAWTESKEYDEIKEFMKQQGFTDLFQIDGYFSTKAQQKIKEKKKTPIVFEEIFDHGYAENGTIVHVWTNAPNIENAISKGFKVIASAGLYLDRQMPGCKGYEPHSCEVTHNRFSWVYQDFYAFDPFNYVKEEHQDGILGMEGCSWDESCDRQNFFNRAFQRYFTIAERMWSPRKLKENFSAEIRGAYFRCLALRRKIYDGVGPISPNLCDLPSEE